jgi:hypothetical protein
VDNEIITFRNGVIDKIDGSFEGNKVFTLYYDESIKKSMLIQVYKENVNKDNIAQNENVLEDIHFYCSRYPITGQFGHLPMTIYRDFFGQNSIISQWINEGNNPARHCEDELAMQNYSSSLEDMKAKSYKIGNCVGRLKNMIDDINDITNSVYVDEKLIPNVSKLNDLVDILSKTQQNYSSQKLVLDQKIERREIANENSQNSKTTNFCYEDEYTGNRYELKLYDKESGEGKVTYNLYKNGNLSKSITGNWEERFIGLGDATKIVISMDGVNSGLGMEFFLRKYGSGAWQDLQEMEGSKRIWSYCL